MNMWELASVLSKALIYGGMLAVVGGMLVLWMNRQHRGAAQIISRAYLLPASLAGLLATCVFFLIQIGSVNQRGITGMFDPLLGSILVDTEIGAALRWHLAGFLLALLALAPLNLPGYPFQHPNPRRLSLVMTILAALCFAAAVASQGHASVISPLAQLLAGIHLLAVACWAGAIYPLFLLISRDADLQQNINTETSLNTVIVLQRFGLYAWLILGVMLVSGISLIWLLTGGLFTLLVNLHGQLLLIKILLVAGMMMLGALHKYRWVPRLRAAIETGNLAYASRGLSRSLRLEMVLTALVLLLTATLTSVTGPAG